MSKRKKRIYPEDEAQLYIRSATDKPGLMERFIDSYKGKFQSGDGKLFVCVGGNNTHNIR